MDSNTIEYIKLGASLVSPMVLFFIQPIKNFIHKIFKNFFNLPSAKQSEAVEYLFGLKQTKNTIECFKQELNLLEFGLHGDALLSKLAMKFYLNNKAKNKNFAKTIFSTKGIFRFNRGRLLIKKFPICFILIFYAVTPAMLFLARKSYDPNLYKWPLIPSLFLMITAFLYFSIATLLVRNYIYLYIRLSDFNYFLSTNKTLPIKYFRSIQNAKNVK
ncbi:hypothetical protein [Rahnella laticis]|uniref:hypothetical protein n=1 Tax=Rahnella laticis TaxID=2787622 RepID=UPI0018A27598|nr:hypothetical protein [Rahnella laticis]MBF7997491.1 hypothetical protein [Rahnella laticis]